MELILFLYAEYEERVRVSEQKSNLQEIVIRKPSRHPWLAFWKMPLL
jgi:hypothetical protein